MREQAFYADATAQLARAQQAALAEREQLTRLLGLRGADAAFALPARLPDLPASPFDARRCANARRWSAGSTCRWRSATPRAWRSSLGLTAATRFVNVLEVGLRERIRRPANARKNGYEIELELPLFDWGTTRVARAEILLPAGDGSARPRSRSTRDREVREAYAAYRTSYDLAKHYRDEIVPLRKRIAEENLLRYNGMLIGVFELLADAREQVASVNAAIEATRDFWLADTDAADSR